MPPACPCLHGLVMFPGFKGDDWYVFVFTVKEFTGDLILCRIFCLAEV